MLSRFTRLQLVAFVVVTITALMLLAVYYLRVPQMLGAGVYEVSLEFDEASGLYENANVTYRGVEIGRVAALEASDNGAVATLQLTDDVHVPAHVVAQIRSASAVGEQYVNLIPVDGGAAGEVLTDGQVIATKHTELPTSTAELLRNTNALLKSIPRDSLNASVTELYHAFRGSGASLGKLIDSAKRFQDLADANFQPTVDLLEDLVPVLQTQRDVAPFARSYAGDLASFTEQLADSDRDLRGAIRNGGPLARELDATFDDLRPNLAPLLADLATVGRVTEAYLPSVEHILIVLPAAIEANQNVAFGSVSEKRPPFHGAFTFKGAVNSPPVCVTGFEHAKKQRSPQQLDPAPLPKDSYCKVPHDDPRVVRGARNAPCPDDPNRRGAYARDCGLVFDRVTVPGSSQGQGVAAYDPETGRVQLPDGDIFRLSALDKDWQQPSTWQELITAPLRSEPR